MPTESLEVTKDGVRMSYGRFLADSAGGYVLLLIAAHWLAGQITVPLLFDSNEAKSAAIIFAGVLLLLLGPPFGLALNATSWFLLGWAQIFFVNAWARRRRFRNAVCWFASGTWSEHNGATLESKFGFLQLNENSRCNLYSHVSLLEKVLQIHFPQTMGRADYLNGIKTFIRNLSLITLAMGGFALLKILLKITVCDSVDKSAVCKFVESGFNHPVLLFFVTVVLICLACFLELYRSLDLLFSIYVIGLGPETNEWKLEEASGTKQDAARPEEQKSLSVDDVIKKLIEVARSRKA